MRLRWLVRRAILARKLGQTDLVFGLRWGFVSRSVQARLQVCGWIKVCATVNNVKLIFIFWPLWPWKVRRTVGWRITFRANIYGPLDAGLVVLQLCRWKFSHKETFYLVIYLVRPYQGSSLFDWSWLLLQKNEKGIVFWATLSGLSGNVRTRTIARWKARGRFYIRHNWTFFAISYGWDVISRNVSKSAFFKGGASTFSADFRGKGASPTNHCWCQKTRVIVVSCGIKISAVHCLVSSQYTGLTDGQNFDSNTVRCITCCTVKSNIKTLHKH